MFLELFWLQQWIDLKSVSTSIKSHRSISPLLATVRKIWLRTLWASRPLTRFFFSCSRRMMNGLPFSSNARLILLWFLQVKAKQCWLVSEEFGKRVSHFSQTELPRRLLSHSLSWVWYWKFTYLWFKRRNINNYSPVASGEDLNSHRSGALICFQIIISDFRFKHTNIYFSGK